MSRPGSAWWLLQHEVRLMRANAMASSNGRRTVDAKTVATWSIMVLGTHFAAFVLLDGTAAGDWAASPGAVALAVPLVVVITLFMMATAMKASSEALFERGDFDLLFSSPVPTRSIMTVRMATIVGRVASIYLFFLAPLAHMGLLLGLPRLLAVYPVTLALAAMAAVAAMLLTLGLVRLFGARTARLAAQVLGPLFGALLFIGVQLTNTSLREPVLRAYARVEPQLGSDTMLGCVARAALGEPFAVALLAAAACVIVTASTGLHGIFARGVQLGAGAAPRTRRPAGALRFRFGRSLMRAIIVKEWLSIARDSQLISQVLLQTLYLVPLAAALFAKTGPSLATTTAAMVFLCASLASALTWIVVSAEDAPDLLASSPAQPAVVARAKLVAVLAPVLSLAAIPALWVGWTEPLRGLIMLGAISVAATGAALIATWFSRPTRRGEFRQRARGNSLASVFDMLCTSAWAATAYLLLHGTTQPRWTWHLLTGAGGTTLCALLFLGLARMWRARL